jgi:hypothetical protein
VLILPKQKGVLVRTIHVNLPRPRDRCHPDFVSLRQLLLAEFGCIRRRRSAIEWEREAAIGSQLSW